MRILKIIEHISLDGVIQNSNDGDDFPYPDWTAAYRTPAGAEAVGAAHGDTFDLLLGRRTYDIWAPFWPTIPSPIANRINAATKYVATHNPASLDWGPAEAVGPDLVEGVRHLKSQDAPNLILSGSSTLISTLLDHDLVDEVLLIVYPVFLGTGKRFFTESTPPQTLQPTGTPTTTPSGLSIHTYKPAGPLKTT
jgi:dihydrofolate reductase